MTINLQKGQRINLTKSSGSKLNNFCVGVNWGALEIVKKKFLGGTRMEKKAVDLDLSCLMLDKKGESYDYIYSPLYNPSFLQKVGLPPGKLNSQDGALRHSGDDLEGDLDGDDGLDNEIITVNLSKVDQNIQQIFFFVNNVGVEDFYQIPFAKIRMYEGTPTNVKEVYASFDVVSDQKFSGRKAMIMGKLYRKNDEWKFNAIGEATDDQTFAHTIRTILTKYSK